MTVPQTSISVLKTTNRSLQLEVAQQKTIINELEERVNVFKQNESRYPIDDLKTLLSNYEEDYAEDIAKTSGLKDAIDAVINLLPPSN